MDFGNAQKVAPVVGFTPAPRADVIATQGGVKVDLPPEKTVQSAKAGDAVKVDVGAKDRAENRAEARQLQNAASTRTRPADERQASADEATAETRRQQDVSETVRRRVVIEPETRTLVLQSTDEKTGETVELVPDETTLKLRVYSRQLAERARAASQDDARFERTA